MSPHAVRPALVPGSIPGALIKLMSSHALLRAHSYERECGNPTCSGRAVQFSAHVRIHTLAYVRKHTYKKYVGTLHVPALPYSSLRTNARINTHAYVRTHTYARIHTHAYVRTHTYTRISMHISYIVTTKPPVLVFSLQYTLVSSVRT